MDKKTVLVNTTFGKRVAEEEGDVLAEYFVETEQWRKVISGDIDIIYGPKGSGKSALYSLLVREGEKLRTGGRRTVMIPAENPRGTPVFQGLVSNPPPARMSGRRAAMQSLAASVIATASDSGGPAFVCVAEMPSAGLTMTSVGIST